MAVKEDWGEGAWTARDLRPDPPRRSRWPWLVIQVALVAVGIAVGHYLIPYHGNDRPVLVSEPICAAPKPERVPPICRDRTDLPGDLDEAFPLCP